MSTASATKASDKALACKKLTALLQKDYGKSVPKFKLPVLETMLFAVCLEDNSWEAAEAGYAKLLKSYFDLNEIRVSSVTELERTLSNLKDADWKGLRIRSILRFVFEGSYSFDFEKLSKLTIESAQKRLRKIEFLSPFVIDFTLQHVLGSHVLPLDKLTLRALVHLGLAPEGMEIVEAGEFVKAGLKKSETFGFATLIRKLATDPKFESRLEDTFDDEFDVLKVEECLETLKAPKKKKKKVTPKSDEPDAASAAPSRKGKAPSKKKEVVKSNKPEPKTKTPAPKKSAPKKAAPKKATAKKSNSPKSQAGTRKDSAAAKKSPKKKR